MDEIDCQLTATHHKKLIFSVESEDLAPDKYHAVLWANHSDDSVLRQQMAVTRKETVITLESEVDHVGFALYRNVDGQCIDLKDNHLLMEIRMDMHVEMGPMWRLRERGRSTVHEVNQGKSLSTIDIKSDEVGDMRDKEIRRSVLQRKIWDHESTARREGNWARFESNEFDKAVEYFLGLLSLRSYTDNPIYLADPYFMNLDSGATRTKLYLGIFQATIGAPLNVLCGPPGQGQPWWASFPDFLTNHVTVRSFMHQRWPAFHDRYLVTRDQEILFTNSFNGWHKNGVTFCSPPKELYRTQAEKFWSRNVGAVIGGIRVQEIK